MAKKKVEETKEVSGVTEVTGIVENVTLKMIVDAGEDGLFGVPYSDVAEMLGEGLVEVGELDGNGRVPVRCTPEGYSRINLPEHTDLTMMTDRIGEVLVNIVTKTSGFEIQKDVPVPSIKRQGRQDKYPFDFMDVNDSFFIPATETDPEPEKRMSSTVSSATARFSVPSPEGETRTNKKGEVVPVMVETRKFVVRARTMDRDNEQGARIWRVK